MPSYAVGFPGPGTSLDASLRFDWSLASQNIGANTSLVNLDAWMRRDNTSGTGTYDLTNTCTAYFQVNGVVLKNGVQNYDARSPNTAVGARIATLYTGQLTIAHNADGTKTFGWSVSFDDPGSELIGDAGMSGADALTTIPRGGADYYDGAWDEQYVEHWNGSAWVLQAVEYYDGAGWVRQR